MSPKYQRLLSVPGYNRLVNDIIFIPRQTSKESTSVVVFFGGDIQDFPENMKSHRDHGAYVEFSLEGVAEILSSKFEDSHILVIRPARIELKTFSCFSNFVICNHIGTPTHEQNHNALLHLTTLLLSVAEQTGCAEIRDDSELIIIGFSKGCVVLNQLLHEFHYFYNLHMDSEINKTVLKQVKKLVWLDGGHSGGKNTWITSSSILSVLSRLNIMVEVHVTPYQVKDERRPWIGQEEKQFQSTLKRLGVSLLRKIYFEEEAPSVKNHFDLLKLFA